MINVEIQDCLVKKDLSLGHFTGKDGKRDAALTEGANCDRHA